MPLLPQIMTTGSPCVRPGIQPAPRLSRLDVLARVGDEVAAVADHHGVGIEDPAQLAVDPHGVNGVCLAGQQRGVGGRGLPAGGLQPREPAGRPGPSRRGGTGRPGPARLGQLGEERGQVTRGGGGQLAVARELAGGVRHVHDLSPRCPVPAAELAVAQPEVERSSHDDDQVSLAERDRPGARDV